MEAQMKKIQEMFNKDQQETKNRQSVMNYTKLRLKINTLEGINSIITETEEQKSELENRMVERNDAEQKKEKKRMKTNEDSLRDLWGNIK